MGRTARLLQIYVYVYVYDTYIEKKEKKKYPHTYLSELHTPIHTQNTGDQTKFAGWLKSQICCRNLSHTRLAIKQRLRAGILRHWPPIRCFPGLPRPVPACLCVCVFVYVLSTDTPPSLPPPPTLHTPSERAFKHNITLSEFHIFRS